MLHSLVDADNDGFISWQEVGRFIVGMLGCLWLWRKYEGQRRKYEAWEKSTQLEKTELRLVIEDNAPPEMFRLAEHDRSEARDDGDDDPIPVFKRDITSSFREALLYYACSRWVQPAFSKGDEGMDIQINKDDKVKINGIYREVQWLGEPPNKARHMDGVKKQIVNVEPQIGGKVKLSDSLFVNPPMLSAPPPGTLTLRLLDNGSRETHAPDGQITSEALHELVCTHACMHACMHARRQTRPHTCTVVPSWI